jgi:hypothetical protein
MELRVRWLGHVASTGERRGACGVLVEKLEGKRLFKRTWHRWENSFEMILKEIR